jgi:hypothetical protein
MKNTLLTLLTVIATGASALVSAQNTVEQSFDVISNQELNCNVVTQDCCDSFYYGTVGVGPLLLIPNAGVGYRMMHGRHGLDVSFSFATAFVAHQFQGILAYHYIVNPCDLCPFYVGVGIAPSYVITNHGHNGLAIAPDFIVGKQIGFGRQFVEAHIQAPTWFSSNHTLHHKSKTNLSLIYVKYGFGF